MKRGSKPKTGNSEPVYAPPHTIWIELGDATENNGVSTLYEQPFESEQAMKSTMEDNDMLKMVVGEYALVRTLRVRRTTVIVYDEIRTKETEDHV